MRRHARVRRNLLRNTHACSTPRPRPLTENLPLRAHYEQAEPPTPPEPTPEDSPHG